MSFPTPISVTCIDLIDDFELRVPTVAPVEVIDLTNDQFTEANEGVLPILDVFTQPLPLPDRTSCVCFSFGISHLRDDDTLKYDHKKLFVSNIVADIWDFRFVDGHVGPACFLRPDIKDECVRKCTEIYRKFHKECRRAAVNAGLHDYDEFSSDWAVHIDFDWYLGDQDIHRCYFDRAYPHPWVKQAIVSLTAEKLIEGTVINDINVYTAIHRKIDCPRLFP